MDRTWKIVLKRFTTIFVILSAVVAVAVYVFTQIVPRNAVTPYHYVPGQNMSHVNIFKDQIAVDLKAKKASLKMFAKSSTETQFDQISPRSPLENAKWSKEDRRESARVKQMAMQNVLVPLKPSKQLLDLPKEVSRDLAIARRRALRNVPHHISPNYVDSLNHLLSVDESSLKILDGRSRSSATYFKTVRELNLTTLIYNWVNFTEVFRGNKGLLLANETFYGWSIWAPKGLTWHLLNTGGLHSNIRKTFENRLNSSEEEKLTRLSNSWSERTPLYFPFHSDFLKSWPNVFLHIVNSVLVNNHGEIRSKHMKLRPAMCLGETLLFNGSATEYLDEVFVLSALFSEGYYHWLSENLPRIAFFLPFLLEHPHIKIHVRRVDPYYTAVLNSAKILGLDVKRFVSGNVGAKLAYVPAGGLCAFTFPLHSRLMRSYYHRYITANLFRSCITRNRRKGRQRTNKKPEYTRLTPSLPEMPSYCMKNKPLFRNLRNVVLIIKRSYSRWLAQHDEVYQIARSLCVTFACEVMVYEDSPPPSIEETLMTFYRARVIIAPHGAGLSNMMMSQSGTFVMEILHFKSPGDNPNINHVNLCFQSQAAGLGNPYHAIVPSTTSQAGPLQIDLGYFQKTLHAVLTNYSYYEKT